MFNKPFEERLVIWKKFREQLEDSDTPIQDCIDFFKDAPLVNIQADAYDRSTWPDPWQMIEENFYCDFVKILAICYTLQLTDRFSHSNFEIHITQDQKRSEINYLIILDEWIIDCAMNTVIDKSKLSKDIKITKVHSLPALR